MSFKGQTVVITGAGGGLGKACVPCLASSGDGQEITVTEV